MPAGPDALNLRADAPDLPRRLLGHAAADGCRSAVIELDDRGEVAAALSYAELAARIDRLAARLRTAYPPGVRLLLLYPSGIEFIVAFFAVLAAGQVAVPLTPPRRHQKFERFRAVVDDCGATAVLCTAALHAQVRAQGRTQAGGLPAAGGLPWIETDAAGDRAREAGEALASVGADWARPAPETLAFIQYTSGSTGHPKGVCVSHGNLAANVATLGRRFGITRDDVGVSWLPMFHDMGLIGGVLQPLAVGGRLVCMDPGTFLQQPLRWWQAVSAHGGTVSAAPNFAFDYSVERIDPAAMAALDLSGLRLLFNGAEPVQPATMRRFEAFAAAAGFRPSAWAPVYGLAEATLFVAGERRDEGPAVRHVDAAALESHRLQAVAADAPRARALPAYGSAAPELALVIVEPGGHRPVAEGCVGEICLRGAGVAQGYWGRAPGDDGVFGQSIDGHGGGFLRTGDVGAVQGGVLHVTGRHKDLIVFGGRNLYPQDIEAVAEAAHPACRAGGAAAFAVDRDGREAIAIVLEVERAALRGFDAAAAGAAVRAAVAREFDAAVAAVVFLKPLSLPRTSSGKVQRARCRTLWQDGGLPVVAEDAPAAAPAAPADEAERRVAEVWAEVFGHAVGAGDDFFALGGHSLMATQIAVRLRERFGVPVPPLLVYRHPTVAAQARVVAAGTAGAGTGFELAVHAGAGPAPLSFSQERMWFFQQLDPSSAAYNLAAALRLRGALDVARLRRAFDAIVARHPALHSVVASDGGVPLQRPLPLAPCDFEQVGVGEAVPLDARVTAAIQRPFDLAADRPLRVTLFALGPQEHVLLLVCHHVAADQWTLCLLADELQRGYAAGAPPPDAVPLPAGPDYPDFCRWQRAWFPRERERLLAYWARQLDGLQPLDLPYDRPRPAVASFRGGTCRAPLPGTLRAGLQRLAARHQATEYIVMLAALAALLHRMTGQDDIAIGAPIANRLHSEAERMVGSFVNTLVMRSRVDGAMRFDALLDRVRETALQAYEHQSMPFEALVNALQPERDPSRSPLVQVFFNGLNAPMPPLAFDGLETTPYPVDRGAAQFDLGVFVDFHFARCFLVEYNDALFERATVEALLARFVQCLEACIAAPETRVDELPLLLPGEAARLAGGAARTAEPLGPEHLVVARFERWAAAQPQRTALVCGRAYSYAELDAEADAMARRIRARLPDGGRLVAVALDRGPALVAALLGTLKAGCAYVPVDPEYPPQRVREMLEQAAPGVILSSAAHAERHGFDPALACLVDREPAPAGPPVHAAIGADAPCYVIFTSGSTGRPKGVQIHHGALANCLRAFERRLGTGPADAVAALTTVSFDIAALELFLPLVTGARIVLLDRETAAAPQALAAAFDAHGVTLAQATPATWQMLLDAGWAGRVVMDVLCGGEAMAPALRDRLLPRVGTLWNVYGPTETTIWSTAARVGGADGPVTIGEPIDNTTVRVLDARRRPVPPGVTGTLHIGGLGVSRGYLGRDDLSAERFADWTGPDGTERLYDTGDLARWSADGRLHLVGRSDAQVKIRGHRVELGDVEAALAALPPVRQAVVLALGEGAQRQLVAYVVPAEGAGFDPVPLRTALSARLPRFMLPSRIVAVDAMPLTPNGKVDRRALPAPYMRPMRPARPGAPCEARRAARTPLEHEMAGLWQAVLGLDALGVDENFFELGGHSLLAVQLVERINRRFGTRLPLATLFQAPTVEALAARVSQASGGPPAASNELPAVVRIQPDGDRPVFFCAAGFGGNTLHLWEVAIRLGRDQPFFGLQPHGLMSAEPGTVRPTSIEALAADYRRQIKAVQPTGPYYLGGFSGGGIDAYEVARQLRAGGDEVALLVLFDSAAPALVRRPPWSAAWRTLRALAASDWHGVRERLAARLHTLRWPWQRRLQRWGGRPADPGGEIAEAWIAHERVGQAWLALARRYRPGPYDGRVALFQIRDSEIRHGPTNGWQAVVSQPIVVVRCPGSHVNFVRSPYSEGVAAALGAQLEAAVCPPCAAVAVASPSAEAPAGAAPAEAEDVPA